MIVDLTLNFLLYFNFPVGINAPCDWNNIIWSQIQLVNKLSQFLFFNSPDEQITENLTLILEGPSDGDSDIEVDAEQYQKGNVANAP